MLPLSMSGLYRRIILVASGLLVFAAVSAPAQPAEVVVRKPGVEENPTLVMQSFEGPGEVGRLLRQTLIRCNWFRVVEEGPADYQVRGLWREEGELGRLRLTVSSGGLSVLDFVTDPNDPRTAVYRGVDTLLNRLFEVPGIASSRIAFVMGDQRRKEIHTMNFDGSQVVRVTNNNSISTEPAWSGNRVDQLFYTYYEPMRMSIMMVDLRAGRQRRVARFSGLNAGARVAPDQRSLALCLSRDGAVNLYVMNLESEQLRQLTSDRSVVSSPAWSPDGRTICYVSDRNGRPHLYLMPAEGGRSRRLLREFDEAVEPDWCPVSNQVAFATRIEGQYVIAVIDMNEGEPARRRIVVKGEGDWESPSWAPDGRHLVCTRRVGRQRQLVMVDTWLGGVLPISRAGNLELADWSGLQE